MIKIVKNSLGDSRTADRVPTITEFNKANSTHTNDVRNLMEHVSDRVMQRAYCHDDTKVKEPYKSMFYRDLCNTIEGNMNFKDGEWCKVHYSMERHHLNEACPDDVDFLDVIEMVCDCICAGMARSGEVRPIEISSEILQKALANTTKKLSGMIELAEE